MTAVRKSSSLLLREAVKRAGTSVAKAKTPVALQTKEIGSEQGPRAHCSRLFSNLDYRESSEAAPAHVLALAHSTTYDAIY
jgi:hypothetical protein